MTLNYLERKAIHVAFAIAILLIAVFMSASLAVFLSLSLAILSAVLIAPEDYKAFLYFIAIGIVIYAFPTNVAVAAVLSLAIGDTVASYFHGMSMGKSIEGTLMNFLVVTMSLTLLGYGLVSIYLAAVGAAAEVGSGNYDNMVVPLMVAFVANVLLVVA